MRSMIQRFSRRRSVIAGKNARGDGGGSPSYGTDLIVRAPNGQGTSAVAMHRNGIRRRGFGVPGESAPKPGVAR